MIPDVASLSLAELRQEWRARFKEAPPAFRSRDLLARALVHRLEGGTPPRLKKHLTELAQRFASDPEYSQKHRAAWRRLGARLEWTSLCRAAHRSGISGGGQNLSLFN